MIDPGQMPASPKPVESLRRHWRSIIASDVGVLLLMALAVVLLHTLVNGQYGFHRDELQTFNNARHLAWGYVEYPPITAVLGRAALELFGNSLRGFRFSPAVAQSLALLLAGLAARTPFDPQAARKMRSYGACVCPAVFCTWVGHRGNDQQQPSRFACLQTL